MTNLGGHDLPTLIEAFDSVEHDRPTCFICYTVKGFGLPLRRPQGQPCRPDDAGADGRCSAQPMDVRPGHEWDQFEGLDVAAGRRCRPSSTACRSRPAAAAASRRPRSPCRTALPVTIQPDDVDAGRLRRACSTRSAASDGAFAERIVTTSPDVTVSTNLGAWVNRRGLFAREAMADTFKSERIPSTFNWEFSPKGQHIELGIAEMNLFILLSALGLSHTHQRRAAAADRHALRSVHRARPRCAELRLLPGRPLHRGGDAVRAHARARRRRAPVDRASR